MKRLHRARAELTRPGSCFEIEDVEIRGVRTRIWKHAPKNLREVFVRTLDFADREYLVYENERVSYRQHYHDVVNLANALAAHFAVRKGDRIAIAMRNYPATERDRKGVEVGTQT